MTRHPIHVMPGLVPGIHAFLLAKQGVDGRDKPGHDGVKHQCRIQRKASRFS
jgi:hypothetical protein